MTAPALKYDLRFANDDDSEEIEEFVNDCLRTEINNFAYLREDARVNAADIATQTFTNKRWIVLETPAPEENIVSALELITNRETAKIVSMYTSSENGVESYIARYFLDKIERIVSGMGAGYLSLEIPHWRDDKFEWLGFAGYKEYGGSLLQVTADTLVIKPTMMMEFRKNLKGLSESKESNVMLPVPPEQIQKRISERSDPESKHSQQNDPSFGMSNLRIGIPAIPVNEGCGDNIEFEIMGSEDGNFGGASGALEGLVGELFQALHKEHES
jgi:hypothetical protein